MKSRQEFNSDAAWWEYYRDYSAAMALQGLISYGVNIYEYADAAKNAVKAVDALITALNETK